MEKIEWKEEGGKGKGARKNRVDGIGTGEGRMS